MGGAKLRVEGVPEPATRHRLVTVEPAARAMLGRRPDTAGFGTPAGWSWTCACGRSTRSRRDMAEHIQKEREGKEETGWESS